MTRVDEDAARLLGVDLDRLAEVAGDLEPWGFHVDGQPVFRVRDLTALLVAVATSSG